MTSSLPYLSVVIPAYNEEKRIAACLAGTGEYLGGLTYDSEVIVVDDGSGVLGSRAIEDALSLLPDHIKRGVLRHERNRGKGAAVRSGCLAAGGDFVAFLDTDLATPPEELTHLLEALEAGADVAAGVRNQADGTDMRDRRQFGRRLAGRAYSSLVRLLLLPNFTDSQCPMKAFRREAAQTVFSLQRIDTWAFDAELLYLADRLGLHVTQVPVRWLAVEGSHLRLSPRTVVTELWNVLRIRRMHQDVSRQAAPGLEQEALEP